jgi:hypothetical protein
MNRIVFYIIKVTTYAGTASEGNRWRAVCYGGDPVGVKGRVRMRHRHVLATSCGEQHQHAETHYTPIYATVRVSWC